LELPVFEFESFQNIETTLNEFGIKTRRPIIGGYRSVNNILKQLSRKWNKFSPKLQEDIACNIAGCQNKNDFKDLMQNMD
jgi:hypothetical protein